MPSSPRKGVKPRVKPGHQPVSRVASPVSLERRVLILAPTGNDARLTAGFLAKARLPAQVCRNLAGICKLVREGCGAILLAEETLADRSISLLIDALAEQPPWSDIPITIVTSAEEAGQFELRRLAIFGERGNVTLLERPFRPRTLVSTVEVALRARQRQYEVRDSIDAIRESELRYKQLVSSLPAAVYTTDADGRVTLYNEAAAALWGRRPEIGRDLWCGSYRIFRPDGSPLPLDECPMAVTLRRGLPVRGEEILIERPDGTRRNVLPYPDPIRDGSGRIVGAVNMLLDITETKRAEEASRRLAAIVEYSGDAIISKDLNGIIVTWNLGAQLLFGYRADEVVGRPVTILIPPDRWSEEPGILESIRHGERLDHYETVRQRKDGSKVEISLTVSPIKDARGQIVGASKIIRDITAQNQAKRSLEQAHREIMIASRAKDDFLAALSHELRTPLNPVLLLASEAADDPELPIGVRDQFAVIRNNIELEARLIDDLLDITRITRGKFSLNLGFVEVHSLLKEAILTIQSDLELKKIGLGVELFAEQAMVKGDAVRLQQVFWNVFKNAVKFTPKGGKITIGTRSQGGNGEIIITIVDNGIGMTGGELARVFEAFAQGEHAHTAAAHQFGGLGLGLAISRKLVESHSGRIQAASAGRGHGTTVTITLPLTAERPAAEPSVEGVCRPNGVPPIGRAGMMRVLLVEDHEPTRTALAHLLTRRKYEVKTAASVHEARELSLIHDFQLLISDIGLPDGNGLELMSEMRARFGNLRGIALTGYGMEQDLARSKEAGFTVHLTKPVKVQSLESALAQVINNASSPEIPALS